MQSGSEVHSSPYVRDALIAILLSFLWSITAAGCFSRIPTLLEDRHHPLASPLVKVKIAIMVLLGIWSAGYAVLGGLDLFAPGEEWRLIPEFLFCIVFVQLVRPTAVVLFCVVVSTPASAPVSVDQGTPRSRAEMRSNEPSRDLDLLRNKRKEEGDVVKSVGATRGDKFHMSSPHRKGVSNLSNCAGDDDLYSLLGEGEDVRSGPRQFNSREQANFTRLCGRNLMHGANVGYGRNATQNSSTPGQGMPRTLFNCTTLGNFSILDSDGRSTCQVPVEWDDTTIRNNLVSSQEMHNSSYGNGLDVPTVAIAHWEGEHDVSCGYSGSGSCASVALGSGSGDADADGVGTTGAATTPTSFLGGGSPGNITGLSRANGGCMGYASSLLHWIIGRIPPGDAAFTHANAMTRWSRLFGWRVAMRLRLFVLIELVFLLANICFVIVATREEVLNCNERISEMSICKVPAIRAMPERLYLPRTFSILELVSNSLLLIVWTISGVECLRRIGNVLTKQSFLRTFLIGMLLLISLMTYDILQLYDELRYNALLTLVLSILKDICENVFVILLLLRLGSGNGKMPRWYILVGSILSVDES